MSVNSAAFLNKLLKNNPPATSVADFMYKGQSVASSNRLTPAA